MNAIRIPAAKLAKTIMVMEIRRKDTIKFGRKHPGNVEPNAHAEIVPGHSIRLFGTSRNGVEYNTTFRVGDYAVYGSYNMVYTGKIRSITAKRVTIVEDHFGTVHSLDLHTFNWRNYNYNEADIADNNLNWLMTS